jgi:hypothetical protein
VQLFRRQSGFGNDPFALEMRFDSFEHRLFPRRRIALEPRFRKFQILHNQIEAAFRRGNQRVRGRSLLLADDIDRRVSFGVRLDELVGLIESRVSDLVLPERDACDSD